MQKLGATRPKVALMKLNFAHWSAGTLTYFKNLYLLFPHDPASSAVSLFLSIFFM